MGLKDIFGKKNDQKNYFKAMKLGDSESPRPKVRGFLVGFIY